MYKVVVGFTSVYKVVVYLLIQYTGRTAIHPVYMAYRSQPVYDRCCYSSSIRGGPKSFHPVYGWDQNLFIQYTGGTALNLYT